MEHYGQFINVDNGKICVQIDGGNDRVVVLLHGGGIITSPVLELKPLVVLLKDDFTVVTIECFGYGLSDKVDKERTVENISSEIHEVLHRLGFSKYFIIAHSISGVYSLYYINKYPDEVEGFIGLDTSVPRQNEFFNTVTINSLFLRFLRFANSLGIIRLITKLSPKSLISDVHGYEYSTGELELLRELLCMNISNKTVMNEIKNSADNFRKTIGMKFPKSMPVLFILANQTCKQIKQWYDLHLELIEGSENSSIITLDGSHVIYRQHSKDIVETFKSFVMSIG